MRPTSAKPPSSSRATAQREQSEGHKVRIFTVNEELPFAGHPTLGTAWCLYQQSPAAEIVLDLKVGKVPVRFEQREGQLFGEMRQVDPQFGKLHAHAEVARVLGIPTSELDENLPIQSVSTGMWFTMVPFRSLATLQNLKVSWHQMETYSAQSGREQLLLLRLPGDGEPKSHPARPHDFL